MAYAYNLISAANKNITTAQDIYSAIIDAGDLHLVSAVVYTTTIHTDASIITIRVYQNGMLLNGQGTQRFKPAGVTNAHYQLGPYLVLSGATFAISIESDNASDTDVSFVGAVFKTQQSNPMYLGASAQSLADLKDFADAGYDPDTNKVQGVVLTDTTTTVTNEVTTDAASRTASKADVSALATTAALATHDGKLDTVVADTNELQTDWTNGGRLDTILDAITGAAGGEGAYTGTLTVDDGDGTGLEGAVVHARRGGVLIASGITDSSGEITDWVFGAYTYNLAVRLPGYQPETDTVTVSADAWTKTVSLTAISISSPSAPTLCTVSFQVKLSSTAVSGAVCKAKLLGINQASDGTILSNAESSDTTDSLGAAELELVRKGSIVKGSGIYRIWVEIAGQPVASVETVIPNQSTIYFEDLLGA